MCAYHTVTSPRVDTKNFFKYTLDQLCQFQVDVMSKACKDVIALLYAQVLSASNSH